MPRGTLTQIYIAPDAGAPMESVGAVRAVPGRGLEGDRYFKGKGSFSRWEGPRREVTLIAAEALEEMEAETGLHLDPADSRRNLLTRGVPLNDLVRTDFRIGDVWMRGVRLCQPCTRLVRLTGKPDALLQALVDRGGLRAEICTEGVLRVGDPVHVPDSATGARRLP